MGKDEIKELRLKLGWTQQHFAEVIGVSFTTVNRWEKGKNRPLPVFKRRLEELSKE